MLLWSLGCEGLRVLGFRGGGFRDLSADITRSVSAFSTLNPKPFQLTRSKQAKALVGNAACDDGKVKDVPTPFVLQHIYSHSIENEYVIRPVPHHLGKKVGVCVCVCVCVCV